MSDLAHPIVKGFYEPDTGSWQYVFHCPETRRGAIVDPVLNFSPQAAATWDACSDELLAYIRDEDLTIDWILDTHPHADHLTSACVLSERLGGVPRAIGEKVRDIQHLWKGIYNWPADAPTDGREWDRLFAEGDTFTVGTIPVKVLFSPGHTLASITYVAGDAAFVHDTLMMPESGTTRADFPGGDAGVLWDSVQEILALPAETRLYVGHDYPEQGAAPRCMATVTEHLDQNVHVAKGASRDAFIKTREARDKTLKLPDRMLAALQINLRGGRLPEPESDGASYLKIPLNKFEPR